MRDADVVVLLGRKQDFVIGFCRPPHVAADAKIIQIDPSPLEIGRNRGVAVGMVGDVASILEQMTKEAATHPWKDLPWIEELRAVRAAQAEWAENLAGRRCRCTRCSCTRRINRCCARMTAWSSTAATSATSAAPFYRRSNPSAGSTCRVSACSAPRCPTALAAKVAYPDARVFMLSGDGAFGFNAMEFDTAVRHKLNVVAILGNDSAWGIDRQIQLGLYGRPVATDLLQTRYDQWCRAWAAMANSSNGRKISSRRWSEHWPPASLRC